MISRLHLSVKFYVRNASGHGSRAESCDMPRTVVPESCDTVGQLQLSVSLESS